MAVQDNVLDRMIAQDELPKKWPWYLTFSLFGIVFFLVWMAVARPWTMYVTWIVTMITLAAFVLIAGKGITNFWRGAFIDDRNKISLSRFQMIIWSIVVLAAYGTMAIGRATVDPVMALNIDIPNTLLMLMGISTTSLIASPLIRNTRTVDAAVLNNEEQATQPIHEVIDEDTGIIENRRSPVVANASKRQAKWADLFMGEEVGNKKHLDLAKIQMFFFTVLLVLAYAVSLGFMMRADELPAAFPVIGDGMLLLMGISHTGYLSNKAVPKTKKRLEDQEMA